MTNDSFVHVKDKMFDNGQTACHDMASRIMADLRRCLPDILKHRPVLLAYACRSVAAGCPPPLSDVDIALVLAPDCGLDACQRFMLELEIAAEIERHCGIQNANGRRISDAPLRVQGQVLTKGRLLYSKDTNLRVAYEVRTRKRYFDFQPVLAMMREAYFTHPGGDLRKKALYCIQEVSCHIALFT